MALGGQPDEVIDGLTGDQRFFMSYAQIWRQVAKDEIMIQRLATDPHSPAEFRTNQILKNVDAFYAAFDVKPGDAMWLDSDQRVRIW
jgi:putative endopeptidase